MLAHLGTAPDGADTQTSRQTHRPGNSRVSDLVQGPPALAGLPRLRRIRVASKGSPSSCLPSRPQDVRCHHRHLPADCDQGIRRVRQVPRELCVIIRTFGHLLAFVKIIVITVIVIDKTLGRFVTFVKSLESFVTFVKILRGFLITIKTLGYLVVIAKSLYSCKHCQDLQLCVSSKSFQ